MSATLTFDTHFFIKKLQEKGFPEPQAETLVSVMREMQEASLQDAVKPQALEEKASKKEVESQFGLLREDFKEVREEITELRKDMNRLDVKISDVKADLMKWMITLFVGQYSLTLGLIVTLVMKH